MKFALSVKLAVHDDEDRILLLRRSAASKHNAGKWDLPGGKVDANEDFDDALIREAEEETGLDVELTGVAGSAESRLPHCTVAYIILRGRVLEGSVRLSSEHDEFRWVAPAELGQVDVCDQFREFLARYQEKHE